MIKRTTNADVVRKQLSKLSDKELVKIFKGNCEMCLYKYSDCLSIMSGQGKSSIDDICCEGQMKWFKCKYTGEKISTINNIKV